MNVGRAVANGAPSRYAAGPDLKVRRQASGGSTPLATARPLAVSMRVRNKKCVNQKSKSVTYVLTQECYLCPDCTSSFVISHSSLVIRHFWRASLVLGVSFGLRTSAFGFNFL